MYITDSEKTDFLRGTSSGGSKGDAAPPPTTAQNFRNLIQFFGKFWQNRRLAPPRGGSAPVPTGKPGSAPGLGNPFNYCAIF